MDCSSPDSSVHGIFQARLLEWVAISSSRVSFWPRDRTYISCISFIDRRILHHCATWEVAVAAAAKSRQSCLTLCYPIDKQPTRLLSLGFSRQEYWSWLPFPSPVHESESESESQVTQLCPTLRDPIDCSLPGSSIHGISQAQILEWVAIVSSDLGSYLPIKQNEIMSFAATWIDLGIIIINEVRQRKANTIWLSLNMYNVKNIIQINLQININRLRDIENKLNSYQKG